MGNQEEFNKLSFRRMILLIAFISILISLIPSIFNFEKYYGLSRFVDQGIISSYLDNEFELYLAVFMSIFSLTSFILIYFFVPFGNYSFLVYLILNFKYFSLKPDVILSMALKDVSKFPHPIKPILSALISAALEKFKRFKYSNLFLVLLGCGYKAC